jgi:pimeloyl-ACP methyl ester carboxylesterase
MLPSQKRLITLRAKDGLRIHALLLLRNYDSKEELLTKPIMIHIHGVLGHFLARGTPRLLPPALLGHGISSLSINTRLAYMGQIMGVYDIEAAVDLLKAEGFHNIFILGYSLGANLVAYYASGSGESRVRGLILEGCTYSLPESQEKRLRKWGSIPTYESIYERAQNILGPHPYKGDNDQIFIIYRAWGPTFNPGDAEIFTFRTWWFMRSPAAHNAKTYKLIAKVKGPVLFIQGAKDDIVDGWEPEELSKLLIKAGNKDISLKYIRDAKHDCMENPDETIKAITEWISSCERRF